MIAGSTENKKGKGMDLGENIKEGDLHSCKENLYMLLNYWYLTPYKLAQNCYLLEVYFRSRPIPHLLGMYWNTEVLSTGNDS